MSQDDTLKESAVNRMTDGAILSMNAWIVSCNDDRKDGNKDALELAESEINKQWNALKVSDKKSYDLTLKYRDFMIAAVYGKAKKYNSKRIDSSKTDLFSTNPKSINQSFGLLIAESQKYDERVATFDDPEVSHKLQQEHAADLRQYRKKKEKSNRTRRGRSSETAKAHRG
eukprot:TRINITY_DN8172_c0_g1_i1.p1 TRINITY_DN8172_c0_g1~~TRINITY_DN8172_c0_g1_i1.p1  ORF type:complete len:171 (+),score=49.86 TRINITY_DN8172_c0_g1_i1:185-697(+)